MGLTYMKTLSDSSAPPPDHITPEADVDKTSVFDKECESNKIGDY